MEGNGMVSVIMPCYNVAPYVGRSIDSVLGQTFTDWELIAVDDGSTDDTGTVLKAYAERDPRIRLITQPNGGVSKARNTAMAAAAGEFLFPLDGDDWLEPACLESSVACMEQSGADACIYHVRCVNEEGDGSRVFECPPFCFHQQTMSSREVLYHKGLREILIFHGGILFRSSIIRDHHLCYPEGFRFGEDNHFINSYLRYADSVAFVRQILMNVLVRSGSATHSGMSPSYMDAVHLNRQFQQSIRQHEADPELLTACDLDYVQLLTASAKNVIDHLPVFGYVKAKQLMKQFGILSARQAICPEALSALSSSKRAEWRWFCRHPLLFFLGVKTHRLLEKSPAHACANDAAKGDPLYGAQIDFPQHGL